MKINSWMKWFAIAAMAFATQTLKAQVKDSPLDTVINPTSPIGESGFTVSLSGIGEFSKSGGHHDFGEALGIGYDINKNFSIETQVWQVDAFHGDFFDRVAGLGYFRLPIGTGGITPYAVGGVGHNLDSRFGDAEWFGLAGLGLELRATQSWSLFTDAKYLMNFSGSGSEHKPIVNFGLRLRF